MSDRKSAERAIEALRNPDPSLAHVVNTVRQSLAEVVEDQQNRIEALEAALANERERCIAVCESWIGTFQQFDIKRTSSRDYAVGAIEDIIEFIREGYDPRAALDKDAGK
jgi:hypothetical protein